MSHKPLKEAAAKKSFPSVHTVNTTCFDECLFIACDNWKALFLIDIYCYSEVWCNRHVTAFFETSDLKEVSILYPSSPQ